MYLGRFHAAIKPMPQGIFQDRLQKQGWNLGACRRGEMHVVGEGDGRAQSRGFQNDACFQGLQFVLERMDWRLLDVPMLVPEAFERHKRWSASFHRPSVASQCTEVKALNMKCGLR